MLIEDFYEVISRRDDAEGTLFDVVLKPECKVYEGHFPGEPVAPGVCNIQMLKECAEQVAGRRLTLQYIQQCRMTRLITPTACPKLEVRVRLDGENLVGTIGLGEDYYLTLKGTVA